MNRLKLIFGTYNSKPVGSYDYQLEEAYQKAYKPFLTSLNGFPNVQAVLHYSGVLLKWFEEKHPEFLMLINDMVERKQVELIGGGFYEPIFSIIPGKDRVGQIEHLTTYLRKRFGKRPRGCWIPLKAWEPALTSSIKSSGMDYIFLDDRHFLGAGLREKDLFVPCVTEDQGKVLTVYPISSRFKSMVPYGSPEAVIDALLALRGEEEIVLSLIEDGDRFATQQEGRAHEELPWVHEFFRLLSEHADGIETTLPGRYIRSKAELKKVYLPGAACEELSVSVLEPAQRKEYQIVLNKYKDTEKEAFVHGGYFRQFLSRYRESNLLYAKMMYTSSLVNQVRSDKSRKKTAREELWKGQTHSPYWHGRNGGIYENHLRKAAYSSLIEAEKLTRERGIFKPSLFYLDFDMDGENEYLFQGNTINAYVHRRGGTLFELDYLPSSWNYLDTMSRYREETDGDVYPVDTYARKGFIDHFFDQKASLDAFDAMSYPEQGNCIQGDYSLLSMDREKGEVVFSFSARVGRDGLEVGLTKKYLFKQKSVEVLYELKNLSRAPLSSCFGVECNLSFASPDREAVKAGLQGTSEGGEKAIDLVSRTARRAAKLIMQDIYNEADLELSFSKECELWSLPVEAVVRHGSGDEKKYQSSCFVPRWELSLKPQETWSCGITLSFVS
jgi:alpha-amylase